MRTSEAALALILRVNQPGQNEFLTQWNQKWQGYSLIGGHRDGQESFRECCIREIEEELELTIGTELSVSEHPIGGRLEYKAMSRSARQETHYVIELYLAQLLQPSADKKIELNPANRWLSLLEIRRMATHTGEPVSSQVSTVLSLACRNASSKKASHETSHLHFCRDIETGPDTSIGGERPDPNGL